MHRMFRYLFPEPPVHVYFVMETEGVFFMHTFDIVSYQLKLQSFQLFFFTFFKKLW